MSLIATTLSSLIQTASITEIARCTDSEGKFDPVKYNFNRDFYLDVIYNYIKDNAEISGTYSGTIPGVGPDPLTGLYSFKLEFTQDPTVIINLEGMTAQNKSQALAIFTYWWNTLISSIKLVTEAYSEGGTPIYITPSQMTVVPIIDAASLNSLISAVPTDTPETCKESYKLIWDIISEQIILSVLATVLPNSAATSTNGGIGTVTFNPII